MSTATLDNDTINYVCTLVRRKSAIELDAAKAYLIDARLTPVARRHGYASTAELVRNLQTAPNHDVQQQMVEAMTTNETSFYRDSHPFDAMKAAIVPELIVKRAAKKAIHIWSAASSTGQEAYSIAMLLKEQFPALATWNVRILGTDLSDDVLEKARAGRFSQVEINRGLPALLLAKYFKREGMQWELAPQIRAMASFQKLNLIERWPPLPTMDVVFLRNVLIYFSPETKRMILEKVRAVMAPGAVLFLGAAETTIGLDSSFERVQTGNSVYYRLK
jgi:chemotaxis protein methyltransferase CheR